jgi:RNA ligase (TIGR02306 family)
MPSSTIAQVLEIEDLRPHPDADRLELATLGGWQIVCGKGLYQNGDRVVYVTPDSLITEDLADLLGVRQHLSSVKNSDGSFVTDDNGNTMLRVRQAKLRGEPSFGTTIPKDIVWSLSSEHCDIDTLDIGTNLAYELGILKYEPAMRSSAGDAEVDHPLFPKYTSIENLRNFPNVLKEGELVNITEKIHGTNCRVGLIEGEWMAGSHGLRRQDPAKNLHKDSDIEKVLEARAANTYWHPLSLESVRNLLIELASYGHQQVVLYGEIYGNVQKKYNYGIKNGIGFRAFDLLVDGRYAFPETCFELCQKHGVETVPIFQTMPYNYKSIVETVENIANSSTLSSEHPMEGVVIKPLEERTERSVGRVIFKYISNKYLFDKGGSDYTDF